MTRQIQVDHRRGMVGWNGLSLASFAIDFGPHDVARERHRNQEVVDSHAVVLVKHASPIIPPGVTSELRVLLAIRIDQAPATKPGERLALGRRYVRPAVTGPGV